jgi:hypothetical protein
MDELLKYLPPWIVAAAMPSVAIAGVLWKGDDALSAEAKEWLSNRITGADLRKIRMSATGLAGHVIDHVYGDRHFSLRCLATVTVLSFISSFVVFISLSLYLENLKFIEIVQWRAKSETGLGFQFSGALSRLSACRWQFYGLLARAGLSRRRSLVAAQCPLAPAAAGRRTASSYHISGYLGQRDEPLPELFFGPPRGKLIDFDRIMIYNYLLGDGYILMMTLFITSFVKNAANAINRCDLRSDSILDDHLDTDHRVVPRIKA